MIPIRVPATISGSRRPIYGRFARADANRPAREIAAVLGELDPERLRELAGPGAELLVAHRGRPARAERRAARAHRLDPRERLSARISTAAPTPSGSQTAFSSAWMP